MIALQAALQPLISARLPHSVMNIQIWILALVCKTALCAAEDSNTLETQREDEQIIRSTKKSLVATEIQVQIPIEEVPPALDKIRQLPSIKEVPPASDKIQQLPYVEEPSNEGIHGDVEIQSFCELPRIENARIEPERSANHLYSKGDTVDFNCLPGFHSNNMRNFELVCIDSGQWDIEIPSCVAVTCELPVDLENGRMAVNGQVTEQSLTFGTRITYSCDPGHILEGPRDRWCESHGWSDEEPVCREISCGDLPEILNGQSVGTSGVFFPGNEVEIRCDFGFRPAENKAYLTCTPHGIWDTKHAQCIAVKCNTPISPKNGWFKQDGYERYQTKPKYEFTDKVTFGCESGFALEGKKSITCRENGWTDPFPTCSEVKCPRPPLPANGWVVGDEGKQHFTPGESVTYECEAWYKLRGSAQRTCMEKGWSGTPVECELIGCPPPPKISRVEFFLRKTNQAMQEFTIRYIPFFGTLVLKCPEGQKPNGNQEAVCQGNGKWYIPRCIDVICRAPYYIANGYAEGITSGREQYYYNHKITHRCNMGYSLVGTAVRYCRENGWTDKLPRCEVIRCSKPDIENGVAIQFKAHWPLKIGGTAEIKCNEGYKMLESSAVIECKADGTWNDTLYNKCTEIKCPRPDIQNGYAISKKGYWPLNYNEAADIYCDTGFRLRDDNNIIVCNQDGAWNDLSKICTDESFCTGPTLVQNGRVNQDIITVINGNPDYRSGRTLPVGFQMVYECISGYRMIGNPEITCSENGWLGHPPSCEEVFCPKPNIENGFAIPLQGYFSMRLNGTFKIHCNFQYFLSDNRPIIQCNQDGQWNDTLDKCADSRSCEKPEVIQNGQIKEDIFHDGRPRSRFPVHFRITYQCNSGYQMIGTPTVVCTEGSWSSKPPTCQEIRCSPPRNPQNGMLLESGPFRLNSTATFKCFYGFQLYPAEAFLTCSENGWTGPDSQCIETSCPTLDKIANGHFHSPDNPVHIHGIYKWALGSTIQYSCQEPYKMNGEPEIQCLQSGQWSSDPPVCEGAYCTRPNIEYSIPSSSHFRYQPGDTFVVQCLPGYKINDTSGLACVEDGTWIPAVSCEEILCGPPPPLMFGVVFPQKSYYYVGETVKYACRNSNVFLEGVREHTCTDEGWSEKAPVCEAKKKRKCSSPLILGLEHNLRVNQTGDGSYKIGDSVIVDCKPGFQPMGNPLENRVVCTPHGNWSTDLVNCTESEGEEGICPSPSSIANGRLMTVKEEYRVGDTVTIVCDRGYRAVNGTDMVACLPGGKWEENYGQCVEVWCAPPEIPANGVLENGDLFPNGTWPFHTEAIFMCKPGFQLHGHHWIKCLQNGWSSSPPVCKEITCPEPGTPEEGWKNVESVTVGSRVQFECFSGYQLIGPKERICLKNGQWSDEQPYCHNGKSSCPGLSVPTGGLKSGTYYNENGVVNFACTSGYMFVGSQTRTCKNGTWTGAEALCIGKNAFHIPEAISYQLQMSLKDMSASSHEIELPKQQLKGSQVSQSLQVRPQHIIVYFILDSTTSIGRRNFELQKDFAKSVIQKLNISKCGMRVGVITLSSQAVAEFYPNDFHSKHNILDAMDKIVYKVGSASLQSALEILGDLMKETQSALKGGVAKSHIFLLTDGKLNSGLNPVGAAKRLKEHYELSFTCLALTGQWRKQILYSIATDKKHIFFLDSFTRLHWLSHQIVKDTNDYSKCGRGLNQQTQPSYLDHLGLRQKNMTLPWPWTAFISLGGNPTCRGSLINSEWILTSAWCVASSNGTFAPEDFSLDIGLFSGSVSAKAVYHHPDYNASTVSYNVGLIQLKEPIALGETIRPICLPLSLQNKTLYLPGEYSYVSTWGERNSDGKYPLRHISFPIQRKTACSRVLGGSLPDQTFCAGDGEVQLTTENGDHGGPLIQYQLDSEGQPIWVQIGIASLPTHHIYNYFTDVSKVLNWIRAFVPL